MPNRNGTGPSGRGPRTGRGMGPCGIRRGGTRTGNGPGRGSGTRRGPIKSK